MALLGQYLYIPRNFEISRTRSEGQRYRSTYLRISAIGMKFSEMMLSDMKQIGT